MQSEAFIQGYSAFYENASLLDNAYGLDCKEGIDWQSGWFYAKKENAKG